MPKPTVNDHVGRVVIGFRQALSEEIDKYSATKLPPVPEPQTGRITTDYAIKVYASSCLFYDEGVEEWSGEGCEVRSVYMV